MSLIISKKRISVCLLLYFITLFASAQVSEDDRISDIIETMIEESESNSNYNTSFEYLRYYREHPINLNTATFRDLQALGLLTDIQISELLAHRKKNGAFISKYELQGVKHYDMQLIDNILPYIVIKNDLDDWHGVLKDKLLKGSHNFFIRGRQILEKQKGFTPADTLSSGQLSSRYLGSPVQLYTRYRYTFGREVSYGFTAEKDPGEDFFQGTLRQGFDFYSAHFYFKTNSILKNVAIGDYELKFGQGLIIWSGFAFRKTPYVMNIKKSAQIIKPYTSVNETNFFRGIATGWGVGNWELTTFFSHKTIDGNVAVLDTINDDVVSISSFMDDGYHRTISEMENKNSLKQTVFGSHLSYHFKKLNIGMTFSNTLLSAELTKSATLPYNQFEFTGSSLINAGLDYSYVYQNINFFGEAAVSDNGGKAFLNGAVMSLDSKVDLAVLHRFIEKDYHALFSNIFAEYYKGINENGLYFGILLKPVKHWELSAYFDTYSHPWLRYQIDAPSNGMDYLLQLFYKPSKFLEMYWRFKDESKEENAVGNDTPMDYLVNTRITKIRYNIKYKLSKLLSLQNRVELSRYDNGVDDVEAGFLIYQDVSYKFAKLPISLSARLAYFDTESFNTAIYAYERDVLYYFSVPAYYYRGTRYYLLCRYKIGRHIDLWLRFSKTYLTNRTTISSGLNEIDGNTKSEIKIQLRVKF